MAIRGIVFDKDGTLFDYRRTWPPVNRAAALAAAGGDEAVAARLLALAGHDPVSDEVVPGSLLAAGDAREIAQAWLPELRHGRLEELVALLDGVFLEQGIAHATPVTDLPALFARLRGRGLSLAVASNDSAAAIRSTVARFGLAEHLAFLAGYDSGHGRKPGPGMVEAFCRTMGLAPAEVCVVGDNRHDFEMGRAAGAGLLVGVLTGSSPRAVLAEQAQLVLASIAELETALEAHLAPVGQR